MPCWFVGRRDAAAANAFLADLASRVSHKIALTTDGHEPYIAAAEAAWGSEIDYTVIAVSFHFYVYNLIAPHETLTKAHGSNCTPAMAAGLVDRPHTFEQMVGLLDPWN